MNIKIQAPPLPSPLGREKVIHVVLTLFFLLLFLLPAIVDACPLCQGGATKKTTSAYEGITLLLGLMPIVGGIGIFYWIHRKSKQVKENKG